MVANYDSVRREAKLYADEARRALPVDKVILFGSYAKGTADGLSDVDIAFFIRDFGSKTRVEVSMELLRLTHNYKAYFEPLVFPTAEITKGNPFVSEIFNTGYEI